MKTELANPAPRTDIIPLENRNLALAIERCLKRTVADKATGQRAGKRGKLESAEDDERLKIRQDLMEGRASDPNGFERVIGESDLNSINFLDRGRRAAAAVCRIKMPMNEGFAYGTGFLVGARLLMTNNHVIASRAEASQVEAEFGFEHDVDGVLTDPVQFNLRPDEMFFTDSNLDFTLVAVAPFSEGGVSIERFGRLPLIPVSGKGVGGEWVSIVQHPNGQPKQIAIRASQIISLDPATVPGINLDHFIHYSTDTEPGSSGSPVFNDQWQVVAIHHKAVPAPVKPRARQAKKVRWIANEGVRISAIFGHLSRLRFEDDNANLILTRLSGALGFPPAIEPGAGAAVPLTEKQYAPFPVTHWNDNRLGYDSKFLSRTISLDAICAGARSKKLTAPLLAHSRQHRWWQAYPSGHPQRYLASGCTDRPKVSAR